MRRRRFTILLALISVGSSVGSIHAMVVDEIAPFVQPDGTHFPAHVYGDGNLAVNANHGPCRMMRARVYWCAVPLKEVVS